MTDALGTTGLAGLTAGVGMSIASLVYAQVGSPSNGDSPEASLWGSTATLELGNGAFLISLFALLSMLFPIGLLPAGTYSLWRLDVAPLLVQRLTSGLSVEFGIAIGLVAAWVVFVAGFLYDRRKLVAARHRAALRADVPQITEIPALKFGIAAAFVPVAAVLGLPWIGVVLAPPVLAASYLLHRTSVLSTGDEIWARIGSAGSSESELASSGTTDVTSAGFGTEARKSEERSESGTSVFDSAGDETPAADHEESGIGDDDTETRIFARCSECGADLSAHGHPDVCPECGTEQ